MAARKKKRKRGKQEEATGASPWATIKATFFSLLASTVILYLAGFFFVRTEGFRDFLEDQVEKAIGERVEIGDSRCTWGGDLVLENLTLAGPGGEAEPVAGAETVRAKLVWLRALTRGMPAAVEELDVAEWHIDFRRDGEGNWYPTGLAPASEWLRRWGGVDVPEIGARAAGPADGRREGEPAAARWQAEGVAWDLRDGRMAWHGGGAGAAPYAEARGIRFARTPLQLPTRPATHYYLRADTVAFAERTGLSELEVEILMTEDGPHVLGLKTGEPSVPLRDADRPAWQRYPLAEPPAATPSPAALDDAEAFQARIRRELEAALEE